LNPFKKLAGQTAIYGLPTIVGRLLNYFLVPLYTYRFSPEEYGVNTELYSYVSFFMVILTYGMETTCFRFANQKEDASSVFSTALSSLLVSSISFLVAIYFLRATIGDLLGYSGHIEYITWFAWILALDAISAIPFAKLRHENKPKIFALIRSLNIFINIGCNLFFIVYCANLYKTDPNNSLLKLVYDPSIGIGYIFLSNLIASAATLLMLLPAMTRSGIQTDKPLLKEMLGYSLPLLVAGLAGMVNETLDRILLKYLSPAGTNSLYEVGIYGACYKIAILMTIFIQTYRYAAEPFFFSHANKEDSKKSYATLMNYFVFACTVIFLGTMLFMDYIKLFIGKEYRVGLNVVPVLLLANLFLGIFFNLSVWYKLTGTTAKGAYLAIIGAAITILLNILWIPEYGYTGCAWATLVCYFSMAVISYVWGNKHYHVNYDLSRIGTYLIISLLLWQVSRYIEPGSLILKTLLNTLLLFGFIAFGVFREFKKRV
jgi:O-antigen/teichoic acid export membrane protein